MTNINIQIPSTVHQELKVKAVLENKTLKELIIEKLDNYLEAAKNET